MQLRASRRGAVAHFNLPIGLAAISIGAGFFTGAMVVRSSGVVRPSTLSSAALLALLAIAGLMILLSFPPTVAFVSWLALAPLLQNSATGTAVGNALSFALYLGPPLVFLLWTLTASSGARPSFIDFVPLAYLLMLLASVILASSLTHSALRDLYQGTAVGIIVYYLAAFGPLRLNIQERVFAVVMTLATVEALMSVVDGATGWNLWGDAGPTGVGHGPHRAVATLASPGILGTFIGIGIVLAIAVLVWQGPRQLRRLAVVTIVMGFPGMFFTLTRGPIVATVVVAILLLLTRRATRVLAFVVLLLATAILGSTWGRISSSTLYRERVARANTVEIRVELQHLSLQLWKERPIFGWGYRSFDRVKELGSVSGSISRAEVLASTSHDTFLTVLVEHGAVGLGLLLVPWLVIGWRSLGEIIRHPQVRWFLCGSLAVVAVTALSMSTYDSRYFSFVPALPWLFVGLLRRHELAARE